MAAATDPVRRRRGGLERRMLGDPGRSRVSPALAFVLLVVLSSSFVRGGAAANPEVRCSRSCVAQNCNSIGIRYGKFCGVGWTGCPGEKPCDELDGCCKAHDECVEQKGLMSVKCHEKFKNCIRKVKKSGKDGFSEECPYETAIPTMIQGMDMAILFSHFWRNDLYPGQPLLLPKILPTADLPFVKMALVTQYPSDVQAILLVRRSFAFATPIVKSHT
ncbi:probable phospholipase A2 homolog 1 [Phoenix dactylifera]|uniref:phospholipase A2 n=1 Tax=Phoenix dactylifera TaxID=42345 RepID=A0A8B7CQT7_PHODC|nr:probable phospholipase A2 homolog 1 [Phoenix dactylifera]